MNSATFVNTDIITRGNWQGVYGTDGYNIEHGLVNMPSYATVTFSGQTNFGGWTQNPNDTRAILNPTATATRIASCWYSGSSFVVNVSIKDNQTHQISLYFLDWDTVLRKQSITVTDTDSGAILDTKAISNFHNGVWLSWNITGNVSFTITHAAGTSSGPNAVLSSIMFSSPAIPQPTPIVPAPIITFTTSSTAIPIGTSATLSWNITGATSATLNGTTCLLSGTSNVSPIVPSDYTLVASGAGGSSVASVSISPTVWPVNTTLGIGPMYPIIPDPTDIGQAIILREAWDFALPTDSDVDQNQIGDCYLLAVLRSLCHVAPMRAKSLVTDFGDGTYGVVFYNNFIPTIIRTTGAVAKYGDTVGISGHGAIAIIEKAYCYRRGGSQPSDFPNSYQSISAGSPAQTISQLIKNASGNYIPFTNFTNDTFSSFLTKQEASGKITCAITSVPKNSNWVGDHCYAISFGTIPGTFKAMNPWGVHYDIDNVDFNSLCENIVDIAYEA